MIIGLTGRVGTGKTYVTQLVASHFGFWIADLDKIGHECLEEEKTKENLVREFGPSILETGHINRSILGDIVFSSKHALETLNGIVHPSIKSICKKVCEASTGTGLVVGALIEEIGLTSSCDKLIVLDAEDSVIKTHSREKFSRISPHQKSREAYLDLSPLVLHNSFSKDFDDICIKFFIEVLK